MRNKRMILGLCAAIILLFAFTLIVHRGYVGVIDSRGEPKILRPGPHLRPPWQRVTFYPVVAHEITVKSTSEGSRGRCTFDLSLTLSVTPDSVASLHRAYRGKYVESAITPLVEDFLLRRGGATDGWSSEAEKAGKELAAYLNSALNPAGVYIYTVGLRNYSVQTDVRSTLK